MPERILITGGAGFIGSHLADALIERGDSVRVLDSLVAQVHALSEDAPPRHLHPAAEFMRGDVRDRELLDRALEGVDAVVHLAAEVGVGQSMYAIARYVSGNTLATAVLLEALAARRAGIRKLLVASSMSIYGEGAYRCPNCGPRFPLPRPAAQLQRRQWELSCAVCGAGLAPLPTPEDKPLFPASVYAIGKQDQEQLSLVAGAAYGIPVVALRLWNVYGPRQSLSNPYTGVAAIFSSRLLQRLPPLLFEDGEQQRDFVHVGDVVDAFLLALDSPGANGLALNISSGEAVTIRRLAELLAAGLACPIAPQSAGRYRAGDIRHCLADIALARRSLGYAPRRRLAAGIAQLLDWVRWQTAAAPPDAAAELAAHGLIG